MPEQTDTPPKGATERATQSSAPEVREAVYSPDDLSALLGVSPVVLAGAIAMQKRPKQEYAVDEGRKIADAFLKHEDESEMAQADPEVEEG